MGPRRYGRSSITLVDVTSQPPAAESQGSDGHGDLCEASAGVGTSSRKSDGGSEGDGLHAPAMDGFDFSSSTSAWKPDVPLAAAGAPSCTEGPGAGAGASGLGEAGAGVGGGARAACASSGGRWPVKQASKNKEPSMQRATVSTAFIGEHGVERAKLDDIEFAMDGLHPGKSLDVRTTAALQLAKLCRDPDMRQLLRSHSLVHAVMENVQSIVAGDSGLVFPAAAALFYICQDAANVQQMDVTACRTIIQTMSSRSSVGLGVAPAPSNESEGGGNRRFKKRKAGVSPNAASSGSEDAAARAMAQKVVALCLEGDDIDALRLPSNIGNAQLLTLLTAQHLMIISCTILSQRSETFRATLRTVGGIPACVNIIDDSLLALSLDLETSPSKMMTGKSGGAEGGCNRHTTEFDEWDLVVNEPGHKDAGGASARHDAGSVFMNAHTTNLWRLARDLSLLETITFENEANREEDLEQRPSTISSIISVLSRLSSVTGARQFDGRARASPSKGKARLGARNARQEDAVVIQDGGVEGEDLESVHRQKCILAALRVLVNLTNRSEIGCSMLASANGIQPIVNLLEDCSKISGNSLVDQDKFDVLTLALGVLINGVEDSSHNRELFGHCKVKGHASVWDVLVHLLRSRTGVGGTTGETGSKTKSHGRGKEASQSIDSGRAENVKLDKLGMDDVVVCSYASVLIGCAIRDNEKNRDAVMDSLGASSFRPCIQVLDYFIVLQRQTNADEKTGANANLEKYLQSLETVIEELTSLLLKK